MNMSLPERTTYSYRHVDTSRTPTTIPNVDHFLRGTGGESCRISPTYSSSPSSPFFERFKQNDHEDDHGLYQKKSVLSKVKEKARKFRYSLSNSKRRMEDDNVTPSWGFSLEDDEDEEEDEDEDAEYLGAPMYESELAPEGYKENARQHPRANPVISEKHVLHNTAKLGVEEVPEKSRGPVNSITATSPNMTSQTIAQKLTPVYADGSKAAHCVSSKIQAPASTTPASNMSSQISQVPSSPRQNKSFSSASLAGKNTSQKGAPFKDYLMIKSKQGDDAKAMSPMQNSPSLYASASEKNITSQKSASVKDYMMNKSEPKDAAKTVSQPQMTSGATTTSPRRTSSNAGVIDKVRGAVNSFLGNEEPSEQYGVKTPTTRTFPQTQQVDREENCRRIPQAN